MKYIVIIIVLFALFFGFLWIKRANELPTIKKVVSDFFISVDAEDRATYEQYLHPAFKELFANLTKTNPENFTKIKSVEEGTGSLKVSTETGTTFEYVTTITYIYDKQLKLLVKLVKEEGKWLIYGLYFDEVELSEK